MDCDVYTIWLDRLHLFINANSRMDCDVYTIWLDRHNIVIALREKRKSAIIQLLVRVEP